MDAKDIRDDVMPKVDVAADKVASNWEDMKEKAKAEWCSLSDDDLDQCGGRFESMVETLCKRYGMDREEARNQAEDWAHRNNYLWGNPAR